MTPKPLFFGRTLYYDAKFKIKGRIKNHKNHMKRCKLLDVMIK